MIKRLRPFLPVLIWGVAILAVVVLWMRNSPSRAGIPAMVEATRHQVGPVEPGRLGVVLVVPGDDVEAGQVLARFDVAEIDAEIDVARALVDELLAEVEATATEYAGESRDKRLSIATDLAKARASLAEARSEQASRQAELASLSTQLARLDGALKDRLAEADRMAELRSRQQSLVRETDHGPATVKAWTDLAREVAGAMDHIDDQELLRLLAPHRARVETQTRRVRQLLELREQRVLRAPAAGRVSAVLRAAGDAVAAAEPVVVVVPRSATWITAYAPAEHARSLEPGARVEATLRDRGGPSATGVVDRLGPEIVQLPMSLWTLPNQPLYGRAVHIRVDGHPELLPGEMAFVRPHRNGGAQAAPVAAGGPPTAVVPAELRARSRLEPSGAIWVPEWDRLLVVSDDTGHDGPSEHVPMVFTATADGRFDAEPVPVEGVPRVSDLEAVARAPDGAIFLLSSQSLSKGGKRPEKRQWLLRARVEGRKLRVDGKIALYDALERGLSADARAELGLGPALDIEGMAWLEGDLLLGLKAPLTTAGRAQIWRLHDVAGLLERGRISGDEALSRWRELALPTGSAGAPGGISDLLLDGTQLHLTSTLPEGPEAGAAWRLNLEKGATPERLASWDGLKPEALARAGDGGLVVLFDTGDAPPRHDRLKAP